VPGTERAVAAVSFVTRATCPHKRGVFVWLADGPQRGDQSDPNWGRYPWVHDTTAPGGHGLLEVCDRMQFVLPVDCGEMCACGHSSDMHKAAAGPLPAGLIAKPRACHCACPDFRHRREDIEKRRGPEAPWVELAKAPVTPAPAPKVRRAIVETVQGSLFDEVLA
jgi:hypothetical protein